MASRSAKGDNKIVRKAGGKSCPIDFTLDLIGGKWTLNIIHELLGSAKRHTELSKCLGGVNPKTLTNRLRLLEKQGLVKRTAFQEIPPRVEYCLTERGKDLSKVISALKEVGIKWQGSVNARLQPNTACETCFPDGKNDGEKKVRAAEKGKSAAATKKR